MNRSEAGKLGRLAVNLKYPEETRRFWCRKGAEKLNSILPNENRVKGGLIQSKLHKSIGAFNSAKKKRLSSSEFQVAKHMASLGFTFSDGKESDFEIHSIINTSFRPFEVDFVNFENGLPKTIIEVTSQKSELKGESIAFKAIKIKQDFPEVKFIAIVSKKMVSAGLAALRNECDEVFFIEDISNKDFFSPKPQGVD
ncbi:hypothetical protein HY991_05275 [Candidatus Micrarchaeota archaeon]|nr:hypothetical protein [Candidatus Micrarchaeota archaeon]